MNITLADTEKLKQAYDGAVRLSLKSFVFENTLGQIAELDVNYAHYLLEYLTQLGGGRHDRTN